MIGSPSLFRGYDTRTYNLVANVAQSLPSAREFMIISATIDITALNFSMGDDNGDQEVWPFGVIIGIKEGSVKARIGSTVNQTVVIAMLDGDVTIKDNRFAPGAGSLAVTEADGANAALGAKADASATTDGGTFSLIALFKRMLSKMGPVTSVDGGLVSIGATTDASATTDGGTFSLIALVKRLLSKIGPVTSIDGGLVSIGATTDAAATTDAGTFSLIALTKRLLGKSFGGPDTYGGRYDVTTVAGSNIVNVVVVTSGANVNGVLLSSCIMGAGDDPTAVATVYDTVSVFMRVQDGRSVSLGSPIILPAGQQLAVYIVGKCYITMTYRVL